MFSSSFLKTPAMGNVITTECIFNISVVLGVIKKEQPPEVFLKVSQNSQKNTCVRVQSCRPQTLAQMFFSEFCKMFKNNFFEEHL